MRFNGSFHRTGKNFSKSSTAQELSLSSSSFTVMMLEKGNVIATDCMVCYVLCRIILIQQSTVDPTNKQTKSAREADLAKDNKAVRSIIFTGACRLSWQVPAEKQTNTYTLVTFFFRSLLYNKFILFWLHTQIFLRVMWSKLI